MDGGTGSTRHIQDPEGLLRSALEKIVFFECRVSQLESELAAAKAAAERARADAARARQREVELEQALAGEKGQRNDGDHRLAEAEERVRLLAAERERLLSGLVERARIAGAPESSGAPAEEEGQADLAGFIAELRAEIEELRVFKEMAVAAGFVQSAQPRPAQPSERGAQPASVAQLGGRFGAEGRVGVTSGDAARMKELFATRADRALYERSMCDLDAKDAGKRLRAVRALEALGSRAAAPLLAAALSRESEAEVKAALLAALARLKEPFAADLAERELADPRPAVRIAAIETIAAIGEFRASEPLTRALSDESPLVRRRAALLLGFSSGERADEALAVALCDPDRGVARAAAAALSGRPSVGAQAALARGLEHADASVRRATATALGRLSGEKLEPEGTASARRASCRRISEKLAAMDGEQLRSAVLRGASAVPVTARSPSPSPAPSPATSTSKSTSTSTSKSTATATGTARTATRTPTAPAAAPARAPHVAVAVAVLQEASDLEPKIVGEMRAALRGCTPEGLASVLATPQGRVEAALASLVARGAVERRGTRWFVS